eukprot:COSAG01_NODE_1777_length_9258_cov_7.865284_3_plen_65_part_00
MRLPACLPVHRMRTGTQGSQAARRTEVGMSSDDQRYTPVNAAPDARAAASAILRCVRTRACTRT